MKRVWRCDYCSHNEFLQEKMKEHEKTCSSNPIFKKCWSCKFHESSYDYSYTCDKVTYCWDYEDDGNCPEWQTDDEKFLRKIKLKQINANI